MESITFKSISNAQIKLIHSGDSRIEFHEKYLRYFGETIQEQDDESLGIPKEKRFHWDEIAIKQTISGILVAWSNTYEIYQLVIIISGNENWVIEYEEEKFDEAIEVRDKILKWLLS